ncbi:NAD-dependent epimerase/dehydratase family protein [Novosphingobium sp. KCTC 2891]|uniref:NAD-dependent epimerase/dehydratase family protein n=1 Tax=Novosphingobium sp. KCTC 2891 TaxID=2989730 RepID=UPI0022227F44|nr:NAD-dependent epimerase/dehydratase family protein [Novosphingobium sp. KCTC 2891]MCW1384227.1 NAD-dependent epimerase/dehydratase family protein [Novosphingobium sp. KCTC 2891]
MDQSGSTVLVTGGSGYIAGFLIRQLLAAGWTVHTTVRSLSRENELRPQLGGTAGTLRFFAADLNDDAGWDDAAAGCSHVAHVASPFPLGIPKDADELVRPAREGALRALRAAKRAGAVRFVQTSSFAAVGYGHGRNAYSGSHTFTERDWTNLEDPGLAPYIRSKTVAERTAREWVAAEGEGMEFVTVNPVAVLGPVASADISTSIEIVRQLLTGAIPALPDVGFGVVDVRDVADLHVRALTVPGLSGERFLASGPFLTFAEIAAVLKRELGHEARKVPTRRLPDWIVRTGALFSPSLKQIAGELGKVRAASSDHARHRVGWTMHPAEQTVVDTARSLIDRGIVKV